MVEWCYRVGWRRASWDAQLKRGFAAAGWSRGGEERVTRKTMKRMREADGNISSMLARFHLREPRESMRIE
jgi:hypothetical protein